MGGETPSQRTPVTCRSCGELLGHIEQFGTAEELLIDVSCPCGGSTGPIRVSVMYRPIPSGALPPDAFLSEIERAIARVRRDAGPRIPRPSTP